MGKMDNKKHKYPSVRRLSLKSKCRKRRHEARKKKLASTNNITHTVTELPECDVKISNEDMYEDNILAERDDSSIVENSSMNDNAVPNVMVEGRRIVDFSFVWNEIHKKFDDHAQTQKCQLKHLKLINSCCHGLLTQFFFKCVMCNYEDSVWSEPAKSETFNINTASVTGTISIGIDFLQPEGLCAAMNVPCKCEKSYIKSEKI